MADFTDSAARESTPENVDGPERLDITANNVAGAANKETTETIAEPEEPNDTEDAGQDSDIADQDSEDADPAPEDAGQDSEDADQDSGDADQESNDANQDSEDADQDSGDENYVPLDKLMKMSTGNEVVVQEVVISLLDYQ